MIDISGYKIERVLGTGGMATVYLAIQKSFEREVALKVMKPSLSDDPKFSERFVREAKIVSRLVHPNIVTVYDVGVENGHHFLSMEYIPGKDLKSKRRFMTAKQCLKTIKDVASALDYAGKKGYVHRDVKPENIMLHEDDGRAILMDFGIACMEDTTSGMTQTGTAIGTPHYMSPEQAKGRQVDSRSDIYSLGVVFYLCLTGHVPFDADSAVAVGIKHVSEAVPRMPKYLMLLQSIVDRVLAKDPGDRYQNGQELIAAINQISDEDLEAIDILATKKTIARIDTKDTEAPTILSGSVKTVPSVQGSTQTMAAAKISSQTKGKPDSSLNKTNASVTGRTNAGSKARKKTTVTGSVKRHTTGTTSPIRATTGSGEIAQTGTQPLGATEVLSVDDTDRFDRQSSGEKSRRIWPWLLVASVIGVMAGSYYFKSSLPPQLQQVVEQVSQKVEAVAASILGTSEEEGLVEEETSSVASADEVSANAEQLMADATGTDPAELPVLANGVPVNEEASSTGQNNASVGEDGESLASTQSSTEQVLGKARSLSDQLEEDISVAPELAQMYRDLLAANPDNKNAELGLANLKQFHFSHIRDALRVRDIDRTIIFLDSLKSVFDGIGTDETYQRLLQRNQNATDAQVLINQGDEYLSSNNLTTPSGANALESYEAALAVDVGNPVAEEGLDSIVMRYLTLGQEAFKAERFQQTAQYVNSGLAIDGNHVELKQLQRDATQRLDIEDKVSEILANARLAKDEGRFVTPPGDNAFEYFQQLRPLGRTNEAMEGVADVETSVARRIESDINNNNFDGAKRLLLLAKEKFVTSQKLLGLEVSLEQAVQADFEARQPKILTVLASNQPIQSIDVMQQNPLSLERTVHIGFEYKNFEGPTSVVQAVLFDGSRSAEYAQQPVIVSGTEDVKFFQIDLPVEGFAKGSYNIDLLLDGKALSTLSFQVDNYAVTAQQ